MFYTTNVLLEGPYLLSPQCFLPCYKSLMRGAQFWLIIFSIIYQICWVISCFRRFNFQQSAFNQSKSGNGVDLHWKKLFRTTCACLPAIEYNQGWGVIGCQIAAITLIDHMLKSRQKASVTQMELNSSETQNEMFCAFSVYRIVIFFRNRFKRRTEWVKTRQKGLSIHVLG